MAKRPKQKNWKQQTEKLFDDFKQRAGGNDAAAAILVLAHRIGGLEHWLQTIAQKKKKKKKKNRSKNEKLVAGATS